MITKIDFHNSMHIGLYIKTSNKVVLVSELATDTLIRKLEEFFGLTVVKVKLGDFNIIGPLIAMNDHGILLPRISPPDVAAKIKKATSLPVEIVKFKETALGNLILANGRGALVSPRLSRASLRKISDVLDVEVVAGTLDGRTYVGSLGVANNYGCIVTPLAKDSEVDLLREALKVKVERGTVNLGSQFISAGLVANDRAALVGPLTDGAELMLLSATLNV